MFGRRRSDEAIRESALEVAQRKLNQGCTSCAEAYLQIADAHGATEWHRRRLLKRAVVGAGALTAASMADPVALLAAPRQPELVRLADNTARNVYRRIVASEQVGLLDAQLARGATLTGYRVRPNGFIVTRSDGQYVLASSHAHATIHGGLFVGDQAYTVINGNVRENPKLAQAYRDVSQRHTSVPRKLASLIGPSQALAACPACPELLGACALGTVACGDGCVPCCPVAAAACVAAMVCCAAPS